MPIHEYQCKNCDTIFEEITLKMSEENDEVECPKCKTMAKKIMSGGTSFHIVGAQIM